MQDPLTLLVQVQAAQKAVRERIWREIAVREASCQDCSPTGLPLWGRLGEGRVDVCLG